MVKYSVKARSPLPLAFVAAGVMAAYLLPLGSWVEVSIFGMLAGALGAFVTRGHIERSFAPADASPHQKRRIVARFAMARLAIGFLIILFGAFALADWLSPAFVFVGGYLAGSTASTSLRERDYA